MGFQLAPRRYKLVFSDPSMAGLEVLVRSMSVDEFMSMTGLDERTALGPVTIRPGTGVSPTQLEALAARIVEWNLDGDDGQPLPVSADTLRALDVSHARALVVAWMEAVSGVSAPLDGPSGSGNGSPGPSPELADASVSLPG